MGGASSTALTEEDYSEIHHETGCETSPVRVRRDHLSFVFSFRISNQKIVLEILTFGQEK